jgi:hypothetical protein
MATLAIALAVASAVLIVKPGSHMGSQASSSPGPSAATSNDLPDRVTGGGFAWTRLSIPTVPNQATWVFAKARGITFGIDCLGSVPGQIWTSTDDLTWTQRGLLPGTAAGERSCASDVIWDGSRYVASGATTRTAAPDVWLPTVWTSPDAESWTRVALPADLPQSWMGKIVFGRGAYVAEVGDELWRSTDLTHWSKVEVLWSGSGDKPQSVVRFDGSAFVAAVPDSTSDPFAYWSTDGLTWSRVDMGGSIVTLVTRPSGFVAVVRRSDYSMVAMSGVDGHTWERLSTLPVVGEQCNLDMLLCGQPGGATQGWFYSSDGVSWQQVPWPAGLPAGNFSWGPRPDPMFITVMNGSGASASSAMYVIQPEP